MSLVGLTNALTWFTRRLALAQGLAQSWVAIWMTMRRVSCSSNAMLMLMKLLPLLNRNQASKRVGSFPIARTFGAAAAVTTEVESFPSYVLKATLNRCHDFAIRIARRFRDCDGKRDCHCWSMDRCRISL